MKAVKFNDGWKFWTEKNAFALVWTIPENARTVTLPHDAMLESPAYAQSLNGSNTGFRDGGVYNYVKFFEPEPEASKKTLMLKFEGVYMNAMVYVNGQLAARCPYGYTGFYVHLNDYLKFGQVNEIRVIVRNSAVPNSRWYSGGGIYRDVYLLEGDRTYIEPDGVRIKTLWLEGEEASVRISTHIRNRGDICRHLDICTEIADMDNNVITKEWFPAAVFEGEERRFQLNLFIAHVHPWSDQSPYLYKAVTTVMEDGHLVDKNETVFGIRTMTADSVHGLRINGQSVNLRGACIHHDSGILGAATFEEAEYRRVSILKKAGFNAIRMAHHPAAPALLRACDTLGMYVMDEAFDMWQRCKSDSDYGMYFDQWWEKDVEAMVVRGYNHPCILMYSVGNEIPEIGTDHGSALCQKICEKIRSIDDTRFTLAAVNGVFAAGDAIPEILSDLQAELKASGEIDENANVNDFMTVMDSHMDRIVVHKAITERLDKACVSTDIAGYNYMTARYEKDRMERPNRVIVGSETYPPEIARNWSLIKKLPNVIGDFTWTGWDYIGEAGVGIPAYTFGEGGFGAGFPCQLAYSGDIDITGWRRPASYYREIVFGLRKEPYIAVQNPEKYGQTLIKTPWVISDTISSWTYPGMEGRPVVIEVYAPGDCVELLLNGRSLGMKAAGEKAGYITCFETVYEPGDLEAVSYEDGKKIAKTVLSTVDSDRCLKVKTEDFNKELVYINIEYCDDHGQMDTSVNMHIKVHVEGALQAWLGSGNPKPENNYTDMETDLWNGRALLIIRRTPQKDLVRIKINGQNHFIEMEL